MTILRYDAFAVADEVAEAEAVEAEMARQARANLRKEKSAEFKEKVAARREELKKQVEESCKYAESVNIL